MRRVKCFLSAFRSLLSATKQSSLCFSLSVVDDLADAVENLLVVRLHLHGVGSLAEHQEQHGVGHEVEAGEPRPFLLQIALQALLALFELDEEHRKSRAQGLAGATRRYLLRLLRCEYVNGGTYIRQWVKTAIDGGFTRTQTRPSC